MCELPNLEWLYRQGGSVTAKRDHQGVLVRANLRAPHLGRFGQFPEASEVLPFPTYDRAPLLALDAVAGKLRSALEKLAQ